MVYRLQVAVSAFLAFAACGKSKPDCEAYAQHAVELSDPAPGKREMMLEIERSACQTGRIGNDKIACVNEASSRDGLLACYGLGGSNTAKPPSAPAMDAAPVARTKHVTFVELRKAGDFQPIAPEASRPQDQKDWLDGIKQDIAKCETDATYAPQQIEVIVTFSPKEPMIYMEDVPQQLESCLKSVFILRRQPPSTGNGPASFMIDLGK